MSIMASDKGGRDFKPLSVGVHPAVNTWMVDLGLQHSPFGTKHQCYMRFEVPGERVEYEKDGEKIDAPMVIGQFYTVSLSEKSNLRPDLEGWRGKPFTKAQLAAFDITKVLGKPCTLIVGHKEGKDGKPRAYVQSITKATEQLTPEGDVILYDDAHHGNLEKLPEWLQEKIKSQVTPELEPTPEAEPVLDDDIPF
jgi:hypothetical protein